MEDKQSQATSKAIASAIFWTAFLIVTLFGIPEILKIVSPSLAEFVGAFISIFIITPLFFIIPIIVAIGLVRFLFLWFRKKS